MRENSGTPALIGKQVCSILGALLDAVDVWLPEQQVGAVPGAQQHTLPELFYQRLVTKRTPLSDSDLAALHTGCLECVKDLRPEQQRRQQQQQQRHQHQQQQYSQQQLQQQQQKRKMK